MIYLISSAVGVKAKVLENVDVNCLGLVVQLCAYIGKELRIVKHRIFPMVWIEICEFPTAVLK